MREQERENERARERERVRQADRDGERRRLFLSDILIMQHPAVYSLQGHSFEHNCNNANNNYNSNLRTFTAPTSDAHMFYP